MTPPPPPTPPYIAATIYKELRHTHTHTHKPEAGIRFKFYKLVCSLLLLLLHSPAEFRILQLLRGRIFRLSPACAAAGYRSFNACRAKLLYFYTFLKILGRETVRFCARTSAGEFQQLTHRARHTWGRVVNLLYDMAAMYIQITNKML